MSPETHAQFNDIVLKGLRVQKGMASFANLLSVDDVEAVHAYLIARAQRGLGDRRRRRWRRSALVGIVAWTTFFKKRGA